MKPWQMKLERLLSTADAPPVLDRDLLKRFAKQARGETMPASTLTHWLHGAMARDRLHPVIKGVYLNAFRPRAGQPADAVHFLRRDAVVSLNTVLGDAGVLNNPVHSVTAIVPLDAGSPPPRLGRVKTQTGIFHFFGMPRRVMEAGLAEDNIDPNWHDHVRATPERALVDWLYLAQSPYSKRTFPDLADIDTALLDMRRLKRVAKAVGVALPWF